MHIAGNNSYNFNCELFEVYGILLGKDDDLGGIFASDDEY
jgi:hypothetical protein